MDDTTRTFITTQLLTLTELANLLGKTVEGTRKYASRKGFDYVLKGGTRWYFRGDFEPNATISETITTPGVEQQPPIETTHRMPNTV